MNFLASLDENIFFYLYNFPEKVIPNYLVIFLAEYLPYILVLVFVLLVFRERSAWSEKIVTLLTVFSSGIFARVLVAGVIRLIYHHARPFVFYHLVPLFPENSYSFPSGHSTFFFAISTTIYLYNKKWGIWFFITTIIITTARIMAGVHYPSDILAGMMIGVVVGYFTFKYLRSVFKNFISNIKMF